MCLSELKAYEPWLNKTYLSVRLPLPVTCNPAGTFPKQHFANREQYLSFASKFLHRVLDFKSLIDSGNLPVDMDKTKQLLCMDQPRIALSSYRRPGVHCDQLITDLGKQSPPHFAVACRDQFYKVDAEQDGVTLSESELYSQLYKVVTAAESHSAGSPPVGILTSLARPVWKEVRDRLAAEPGNKKNLDVIENSIMLLCLDKSRKPLPVTMTTEEDDLLDKIYHALHGQGTDFNSCNRWFDVTCQALLSEDGAFGMSAEHSAGEAHSMLGLMDVTEELATSDSSRETLDTHNQPEIRQLPDPLWLTWTTTPELESDIARAKQDLNKSVQRPDCCLLEFKEFGSDFLKSHGVSPDAFVQLAIHMAYYRLYGRMVMSYESATLRRFRKGREENLRANSPAALAWIQAMVGEVSLSDTEKHALFRLALEWIQTYKTKAISGQGIDCHLIGLEWAATQLNVLGSIPFFSDPSFHKMFHLTLSTSANPMRRNLTGSYSPMVADGYGIPYRVFPDDISMTITSLRDSVEKGSQEMKASIRSCFLEMRDLCLMEA